MYAAQTSRHHRSQGGLSRRQLPAILIGFIVLATPKYIQGSNKYDLIAIIALTESLRESPTSLS
jgi:hypothetical protein